MSLLGLRRSFAKLVAGRTQLREAALEYERVRAPFLALQKGNTNFQTNKRTYWNLVSRLLEQEDGPWTEGFCAYRWGGLCGTGEESFVVAQSRVLLMALAADQRWTEAAGAAMSDHEKTRV